MADALATGPRRVKVYVLTDESTWDDRGTGHVRCEPHPHKNAYVLRVVSERSHLVVLCSQIRALQDAEYQMQEDTIISWTEENFPVPGGGTETTEVALSFAEANGCREVWDRIVQIDAAMKQQQQQRQLHAQPRCPRQPLHEFTEQQQQHNPQPAQQEPEEAPATLTLPLSMAPHPDHEPAPDTDLLVSATDSPMPATSSPENNLHRTHPHPTPSHHVTLVDPATAADISHSSRFFDDNLDSPSPWSSDPIEDVIFRENSGVFFLTGSPGGLVAASTASDPSIAQGFTMPEPTRSGVEVLFRVMSDQGLIQIPAVRQRIITEVSTGDYVSKLCQVFNMCEKNTDLEGLAMLYHIIRCLFIVGPACVLEVLVKGKNLMDVVGCLEYDPEHITELERMQEEKNRRNAERASSSQKDEAKDRTANPLTDNSSDDSAAVLQNLPGSGNDKNDGPGNGPTVDTPRPRLNRAGSDQSNDIGDKGETNGTRKNHDDESDRDEASDKVQKDKAKPKDRLDISSARHDATSSAARNRSPSTPSPFTPLPSTPMPSTPLPSTPMPSTPMPSTPFPHTESPETDALSGEPCRAESVVKAESSAQKDVSEETTSSGNLVGEAGERRLTVRIHREFLERKVAYRSVVPITDPNVVAKIHQNYRVAYIRDVILSRVFDEAVNGVLSDLIVCNNVDIIMYFISGSAALQELFDRLKSAVEKRKRLQESSVIGSSTPARDCQISEMNRPLASERGVEAHQSSSVEDGREAARSGRSKAKEDDNELDEQPNASAITRVVGCVGDSDISDSTGDSNITAVGDPSTSKEPSSHAAVGWDRKKNGSASADPESSGDHKEIQRGLRVMLGFLRELCTVVKGQQEALRNRFHSLLIELGLLEVAGSLLLDKDMELRSMCCDILSAAILHDQTEVRSHMLKNVLKQVVQPERVERKRVTVALRSTPVGAPPRRRAQHLISENDYEDKTGEDLENVSSPKADVIPGQENCPSASADVTVANVTSLEETRRSTAAALDEVESACYHVPAEEGQGNSRKVRGEGPSVKTATGANFMLHAELRSSNWRSALKRIARRTSLRKEPKSRPNPTALRKKADEQFPLLSAMIEAICQDHESGVSLTLLDLLRLLLEVSNMRLESDKMLFLNTFYEKFAHRLLEPIKECIKREKERVLKGLPCEASGNVNHICDLLSFCIGSHSYRSKYFVLGFGVGRTVSRLLEHRKAHYRLSALRIIRACVGLGDNIYDRYIIREKLFDSVMVMFRRNGNRDNLISSAVLDVLSCVSKTGRFSLLNCLLTEHSSTLELSSRYCGAFATAKQTLEKLKRERASSDHDEAMGEGMGPADGAQSSAGHRDLELRAVEETNDTGSPQFDRPSRVGSESNAARVGSSFLGAGIGAAHESGNEERLFARCSENDTALVEFNALMEGHQVGSQRVLAQQENGKIGGDEEHNSSSDHNLGINVCNKRERDGEEPEADLGSPQKRQATVCKQAEGSPAVPKSLAKPKFRSGVERPLVGYAIDDSDEEEETVEATKGSPPGDERSNTGKASSGRGRISFSKSAVVSGQVQFGEGEDGELFSESSEDRISPRKRERSVSSGRGIMPSGGIETCTKAVMEEQSNMTQVKANSDEGGESPTKRRRIRGNSVFGGAGKESNGKEPLDKAEGGLSSNSRKRNRNDVECNGDQDDLSIRDEKKSSKLKPK